MKPKAGFLKRSTSDKALARLTKEDGGEDTYYHQKNERKDITLDPRDIKRSIREYFMPVNSTTSKTERFLKRSQL